MKNSELLSPAAAAELLGVTVPTLREWEAKGKLKVVRTPGNHRRIPRSEIDRLRGDL